MYKDTLTKYSEPRTSATTRPVWCSVISWSDDGWKESVKYSSMKDDESLQQHPLRVCIYIMCVCASFSPGSPFVRVDMVGCWLGDGADGAGLVSQNPSVELREDPFGHCGLQADAERMLAVKPQPPRIEVADMSEAVLASGAQNTFTSMRNDSQLVGLRMSSEGTIGEKWSEKPFAGLSGSSVRIGCAN